MSMEGLNAVYSEYTGGQAEMDGRTYVKVFKELKLIDSKLTVTDLDLIFTKVKPKGGRKINFPIFLDSLYHVAAKKRVKVEALTAILAQSRGPQFSGTQVVQGGATQFHNSSTYTGAAARPQTAPTVDGYSNLNALINRDHVQDDALNRRKQEAEMRPMLEEQRQRHEALTANTDVYVEEMRQKGEEGRQLVRETFDHFKDDQGGGQPNQQSSKPPVALQGPERFFYDKSKYTGTAQRGGPSTANAVLGPTISADPNYRPLAPKATVGSARGGSGIGSPGQARGPGSPGQVRGPERFFYDANTYTGTHAQGGPANVDSALGRDGYADLSSLIDRGHKQNDALNRNKGMTGGGIGGRRL
eukprot:GEMP01028616.1.p1 GENE.GEMP01028616.1~~GEMP01028616.1.p1  ORF type:complete len:358 (+),score=71.90 GEMP01028616.1:220-1293(+)